MASAAVYKPPSPSGRTPAMGILLILTVAGATALGVGWLYHAIAHGGDLILLGPAIAGGLVGFLIRLSVKPAHCRNQRIVITIALLAGILTILTRLYFDSQDSFTYDLPDAIAKQESVSMDQAAEAVRQVRQRLGPFGILKTYIEMQADSGVTIESSGSSRTSSDTPVTGGFYYVLLAASVFLTAVVAAGVCSTSPGLYCEKCGKWLETKTLGMADVIAVDALVAAVARHDWETCNKLQHPVMQPQKGVSYLQALLHVCASCREGHLQVAAYVPTGNTVKMGTLALEQLSAADVAAVEASANVASSGPKGGVEAKADE